jgi:hypothetical protein
MKENDTIESKPSAEEKEKSSGFAISFLSHFITIPLFIILHKLLPDLDWKFHLDRILLFIVTLSLVEMIFASFKELVNLGFIVMLGWLTYGSIWGDYGFKSVFNDYKYMIHSMIDSPHPEEIIISKLRPFPNKSEIKKAINFENPDVRNFALLAAKKHFLEYQDDSKYFTIVQCFAVFKEINENWNYVSDPKGREYFAKASESIIHLSGDCDDHAILMAACIRAIGGTPRLIHTTGHLYPVLLIGDKKEIESINYLIKRQLFPESSTGKQIHYHIDEYGQAWLNLDYTARYPGGKFMIDEILGTLDFY